jgi:outer membrane protein OmpA-like peptidoglycan-associated protein
MKNVIKVTAVAAASLLAVACATAPSQQAAGTGAQQTSAPTLFGSTNAAEQATIDFAAGSVALGDGAEHRDPIKSIAASIKAAGAKAVITGYANADKGAARAQATANYRAQSVYYKLARAGVPKSSMTMATKTLPAGAGADGRKATVSW